MCLVIPKDNRVTTLYTPWTTTSVTVIRNSQAKAQNHLCMLTVLKAEILNFPDFCGTCKDWYGGPLTHKLADGCQAVIQGQGRFTKHGLPPAV